MPKRPLRYYNNLVKILRGIHNINKAKRPVLTLGNFDGVHLGHQAILKKVVGRAEEIGGTSLVFTFEPHPLKILAPEKSPSLLTTFREKKELIAAAGIDELICADFTKEFADQHPEDFARDILLNKLGVEEVYVGHDYAFGRGREGTIEILEKMGKEFGFKVCVIEPVLIKEKVVSSSIIRELLQKGHVEEAASFLGRRYSVEGLVIKGDNRGKLLGYPTANLQSPKKILPKEGVYAVTVEAMGKKLPGVSYIGSNPTFGGEFLRLEVHIFDFDGDLYGEKVKLNFARRIRDEIIFQDSKRLISQIEKDVAEAKFTLKGER